MIAEITAAWSALNTAIKAANTAFKTVEDVKVKEAVADIQNSLIDLQTKLLAAQSQYEALAEVKRQLEQQIVRYEKWDAEAARYELDEIVSGIFVYELKPDDTSGEPTHWLCPNCFHKREKSILSKTAVDNRSYKCQRCQFVIAPTPFRRPSSGGAH